MKFQLTEKNAATVMHVINTFFKKDAFEYFKDVEKTTFVPNGDLLDPVTIIQDEYMPMLNVTCVKHPLAKEGRRPFSMYSKVPVLLFVRSKFHTSGIPLHVGDVVINKGSRLIIKIADRNLKFKDNRHYFQVEWTQRTFVHNFISEENREKEITECFNGFISEGVLMDYEGLELRELEEECHIENGSVREYFTEVEAKIENILYEQEYVEKALVSETPKHKLYLHRNFGYFKEHGVDRESKEVFSYSLLDGEDHILLEKTNLYHVVLALLEPFEDEEAKEEPDYGFDNFYGGYDL